MVLAAVCHWLLPSRLFAKLSLARSAMVVAEEFLFKLKTVELQRRFLLSNTKLRLQSFGTGCAVLGTG